MKTFKELFEELSTSKETLNEGGNIFKGKTSSIPKEFIEETVREYFADLKKTFPKKKDIFNKKHFKYLGSVGKKAFSGDIDFGIDVSSIIDKEISDEGIQSWGVNIDEFNKKFEKIQKRARTATTEQSKIKALLFLIAERINNKSQRIHCDEKKTTSGNMFGFFPQISNKKEVGTGCQIDWMVGNLDWLSFSYHSNVYSGNVKGLHRTQLMLAMFQHLDMSFNHVSGVTDKNTKKIIATSPEEALELLSKGFKTTITSAKSKDYFKLQTIIQKQSKKDQDNIYDIYLRILDRTRADIPEDLQLYWINNKSRLGLTGKFLPSDSNLIGE